MTGASSRDDILAYLQYICSISHRQEVFFLWRPWLKDPKDDMALEAAVASRSDYIITHNKREFKDVGEFGVLVVSPAEFLNLQR
jgi:predicted nucleic acid-binding protein